MGLSCWSIDRSIQYLMISTSFTNSHHPNLLYHEHNQSLTTSTCPSLSSLSLFSFLLSVDDMMLLLYLSLIITVSFYHGCNGKNIFTPFSSILFSVAGVTVTIDDKNVTDGMKVQVSAGSDLMVTCSSTDENDTVSLDLPDGGINITKAYNVYTLHRVTKSSFNSTVTCEDERNNTLSFYLNVTCK